MRRNCLYFDFFSYMQIAIQIKVSFFGDLLLYYKNINQNSEVLRIFFRKSGIFKIPHSLGPVNARFVT